jgi:hypothetical protein
MENLNVILRSCGCASEFQDSRYGAHKRVHNVVSGTGSRDGDARCTVCSTVHGPPAKKVEAKTTKTTGISRMGGKKAGRKGKKGKSKNKN